jgi:hypothetical protein
MASCWPEESLWYYPNMVFNPRRHFTHLAWRYSWIYISYIATTTKKSTAHELNNLGTPKCDSPDQLPQSVRSAFPDLPPRRTVNRNRHRRISRTDSPDQPSPNTRPEFPDPGYRQTVERRRKSSEEKLSAQRPFSKAAPTSKLLAQLLWNRRVSASSCEDGDLSEARNLIRRDANVSFSGADGTSLSLAIDSKYSRIVAIATSWG